MGKSVKIYVLVSKKEKNYHDNYISDLLLVLKSHFLFASNIDVGHSNGNLMEENRAICGALNRLTESHVCD